MTLDRQRLVREQNPVLIGAHPTAVLTVGNGDAAMSVDFSGLQTFPTQHELQPDPLRHVVDGLEGLPEHQARPFAIDDFQIPLRTHTTWGWYSTNPVREFRWDETLTSYETVRGAVAYPDRMGLQRPTDQIAEEFHAGAWFHYNPRRLHLGRLALCPPDAGEQLDPGFLHDVRTELDLWTGCVNAEYTLHDHKVSVHTVADPILDRFAVRVESSLIESGWGVAWIFDEQPDPLASFESPLQSTTDWLPRSERSWRARRHVEATTYSIDVQTTGRLHAHGNHTVVARDNGPALEVVVTLSGEDGGIARPTVTFDATRDAAATWWEAYWLSGGAVSFEGSTDPRAKELQRRIVLSQYLLAVNSSGTTPPAETGLTYNTWSGKFHLEMHWWHAAHFPLWGRGHLLERSLPWYHRSLEAARSTAEAQGYRGARWPKQTDPTARESPSNIGVFLLWQQPHIIHLLEILHTEGRGDDFLANHYPLVEATADFMVDVLEEREGRFDLAPPVIPAQESYLASRAETRNPTFELTYWSWALQVANEWRVRMGATRRPAWDRVARGMAPATVLHDGTYAGVATSPWIIRRDHPSMLMSLGWLPDTKVIDTATMSATLDSVWENWDLQSTWGWDYPVMAMTALALGDTSRALDALFMESPKNNFLDTGHNPQIRGFLTLYLPANGGLLAAVAHLVDAVDTGAVLPSGWVMTSESMPQIGAYLHPDFTAR